MSYFPYSSQWGVPVREFGELEQAFAAMMRDRCDALVVFPDTSMFEVSTHIARYASQAGLPSVSGWSPFARNGLLLTYGPNVRELYRALGRYVDRILRGANPGDLPVERPAKIELVINLKTAKALRLDPPPRTLLALADEVIE
jgi:putative ABC transport system substrate-binding protein